MMTAVDPVHPALQLLQTDAAHIELWVVCMVTLHGQHRVVWLVRIVTHELANPLIFWELLNCDFDPSSATEISGEENASRDKNSNWDKNRNHNHDDDDFAAHITSRSSDKESKLVGLSGLLSSRVSQKWGARGKEGMSHSRLLN